MVGAQPAETAVTSPGDALGALAAALPGLDRLALAGGRPPGSALAGDDTFATTTRKTTLIASLEPADAALVSTTAVASLAAAHDVIPDPVAARAASWLAGGHLYRLEPPGRRTAPGRPAQPGSAPSAAPRYVRCGHLEVRNLLVSNAEYARFLSVLAQAEMPNSHHGTYLLACEMPHERGGRLHQDQATGAWTVSPGYEDYPAYWVTWIGAAAFAAWSGARLPARAELTRLTCGAATTGNAGYRFGDVTALVPGARFLR